MMINTIIDNLNLIFKVFAIFALLKICNTSRGIFRNVIKNKQKFDLRKLFLTFFETLDKGIMCFCISVAFGVFDSLDIINIPNDLSTASFVSIMIIPCYKIIKSWFEETKKSEDIKPEEVIPIVKKKVKVKDEVKVDVKAVKVEVKEEQPKEVKPVEVPIVEEVKPVEVPIVEEVKPVEVTPVIIPEVVTPPKWNDIYPTFNSIQEVQALTDTPKYFNIGATPYQSYKLENGDTVWDLAGKYMGDPFRYGEIIGVNGDYNNLPVGTILGIPLNSVPITNTGRYYMPVKYLLITTEYMYYDGGWIHYGLDFGNDGTNLPIYASTDGFISVCEPNNEGAKGHYVEVCNYDNINNRTCVTLYEHMSDINVSLNQTVKAGDLLGYMGNTGQSTGTHLHFTMKHYPLNQYEYDSQDDRALHSVNPFDYCYIDSSYYVADSHTYLQ